jgi:hypothetical protein
MTIHYNPKNPTALFTFRGTVVQTVARSYLWWCLFTIHCILVYLRETHPEYMEGWGLNWAAAQPTLSLATFFLVFYAGNCYSRFFEFHNHSVAMFGIVMEWAADTKLYFPDRLVRPLQSRRESPLPQRRPSRPPLTPTMSTPAALCEPF